MSVINTNYLSLVAQNNLGKSQSALGSAIERLSSGLRINSAKDDAAGQAIANRMTSQVKGLNQAQRNANDGISVAQTAEGALNQVNDNLQRIRELAVQAQNDTNSADDKASIQAEINQRLEEINRISEQTDFNGTKVLASNQSLSIQVGANDGESIDINLKKIDAAELDLAGFNVNGTNGTPVAAVAADFQEYFGSTSQVAGATVAETAGGTLATRLGVAAGSVVFDGTDIFVDDSGNWFAQVTITAADAGETNALNAVGLADGTYNIALEPGKADVSTPTVAAFTIDTSKLSFASLTNEATANPLAELDNALKQVDELRSDLGAIQNRFESAITNLQTNSTNLQAARSRIEDADYAVEVANMSKNQILQQAGTSVLAQANQIPQGVLSLLR